MWLCACWWEFCGRRALLKRFRFTGHVSLWMWTATDCGLNCMIDDIHMYVSDDSIRKLLVKSIYEIENSLPNLLFQIRNLYSTKKVIAVYREVSRTILRYNQDKKNDRCLLNVEIILSEIEIVSPLLNFLFQTCNLYSAKRKCIILPVISCYFLEIQLGQGNWWMFSKFSNYVIQIPEKNVSHYHISCSKLQICIQLKRKCIVLFLLSLWDTTTRRKMIDDF